MKIKQSKNPTVSGTTSNKRGLQMSTKSKTKSNNQKRGGKRPGAGRPRGGVGPDDRRTIALEIALGGLDRALKAYGVPDDDWTPLQHKWHIAMVLFGVPADTIAAALFKPQVSKNFSRDIADAIKAVEAADAAA
jgi:hypothetical protein